MQVVELGSLACHLEKRPAVPALAYRLEYHPEKHHEVALEVVHLVYLEVVGHLEGHCLANRLDQVRRHHQAPSGAVVGHLGLSAMLGPAAELELVLPSILASCWDRLDRPVAWEAWRRQRPSAVNRAHPQGAERCLEAVRLALSLDENHLEWAHFLAAAVGQPQGTWEALHHGLMPVLAAHHHAAHLGGPRDPSRDQAQSMEVGDLQGFRQTPA